MFWNDDAEKLSKKLWNPDVSLKNNNKYRKSFRCNHNDISFKYYPGGNKISNKLKFKDIPIKDNSDKRDKLYSREMAKELGRLDNEFDREVAKPVNKQIHIDKFNAKHDNFVEKIHTKVDNLDKFVRSHKVQILPTTKQKKILRKWFDDCTTIYNRLVCMFNGLYDRLYTEYTKNSVENKKINKQLAEALSNNTELPLNMRTLRDLKIKEYTDDFKTVPYCVIADIMGEFVSNAKGNITKLKKGDIVNFVFKQRDKNRIFHSIPLERQYTTSKGFYPSIFDIIKSNDPTFKWENIQHDYKLIYDKYKNKYYVHIPKYVGVKTIENERHPIAVMDPGVRTFQTLYGLNHIIEIGENLGEPIGKYLLKIDKLKAKMDKPGSKYNKRLCKTVRKRKRNYKRAIKKCHEKIDNMVTELHYKTSIYLCKNYERIMVTDFSSKKASSKSGDLGPMTKRIMGKISHYKFKQRLQTKCEEYGCQFIEVNESFTSKTCGMCGHINKTLGASKIFECPKCKNVQNRDVNASRNILIKNRGIILK